MFASLWRYKFLIAGAAILAAVVGYGLSSLQAPVYQSQGVLLLQDPRIGSDLNNFTAFIDPTRYIRNQSTVIQSPGVTSRAYELMAEKGWPNAEAETTIAAEPETTLDAMSIISTGAPGAQTSDMVDSLVEAYTAVLTEQIQNVAGEEIATLQSARTELTTEIAALDAAVAEDPTNSTLQSELASAVDELRSIDDRIKDLNTQSLLFGTGIQLYVGPEGPGDQIAPTPARNAAIALILGALAAGAFAWWRAEQDQRADNKDVAAGILNAPLLAVVPEFEAVKAWPPAPTVTHPDSRAAESYHFALSSLTFVLEQIGGHSVVITSADPADGKTVAALNLAVAAMKDGRSPLLIDADERKRGLTHLAGFEETQGNNGAVGNGHRWAITPTEHIDFIASGRNIDGDTAGHFRSTTFRKDLSRAMAGRDIVLIDTPPVMSASETADLAGEVDGVVLIVRENSPVRDIADARDRIALTGTPIVGYIYNRDSTKDTTYGYGHSPEKPKK